MMLKHLLGGVGEIMKTTNSHKTGFRLVEVIFIMVVTTILGIVIGPALFY